MVAQPDQVGVRRFRRALLAWYDRHRRDLPWRLDPPEAYATLVSEFMLQQTQVATVIPYFDRFMRRFPTVQSLARARIGSVLPYWAGLGYYRRCHHLHAAVRAIVRKHGGRIPQDVEVLRSLPGVGAYTAGAVASIAFGVRVPAVDGNVRRVLTRLAATTHRSIPPARTRADANELAALARQLVPAHRPGDFNQALMELGATVCSPRRPLCASCPVKRLCASAETPAHGHPLKARGNKSGDSMGNRSRPARSTKVGRIHVPPSSREPRLLHLVSLVVRRAKLFLYVQRPVEGLWAGLWEWPTTEVAAGLSPRACAASLTRRVLGTDTLALLEIGEVEHQLTHRAVTFHVFGVEAGDGGALPKPLRPIQSAGERDNGFQRAARGRRWVALEELQEKSANRATLPVSAAQRKVQALWLRHASTLESRRE